MSDFEDTGAIDWLLLEGPGAEMNGALVPPLLDLVDRRLIRILDVLVLVKRADDDFDALTTADLDPAKVGDLGALDGASSGLLSRRRCGDCRFAAVTWQPRPSRRVREPLVTPVRCRHASRRGPARRQRSHPDPGDLGAARHPRGLRSRRMKVNSRRRAREVPGRTDPRR